MSLPTQHLVPVGALTAVSLALAYLFQPLPTTGFAWLLVLWLAAFLLSPRSGVAATLATLPLFHQPLESDLGSFAPSELLLILTGLATAAHVLLPMARLSYVDGAGYCVRTAVRSRLVWIAVLLSVLGATLALSIDAAEARDASLRELRWTLIEPAILVSLLAGWYRDTRSRYVVALVWSLGLIASMLPAALDPIRGTAVEAGGVVRISGIYPHPNAMALATTRAVVLVTVLLVLSRELTARYVVPALLALALVVATFARSALVALGAVVLVSAWRAGHLVRLISGSAVLLMFALLLAVAPARLLDGLAGGSLDLRVDIWRAGLAMIRDNPVFGLGPDQFFFNYAPRYVSPTGWDERFTSHAHNFVIDSWIRLGIIGAVFAVAALIWIARDVIRIARGRFNGDHLQLAASLALFAALLQGLVDNAYFVHDLAMSFWLLAWLRFEPIGEEKGLRDNAGAHFGGRWARWIAPLRWSDR